MVVKISCNLFNFIDLRLLLSGFLGLNNPCGPWIFSGSIFEAPRSGLKTDTSQMTPIFPHWQGELSEGIAQLFRGQINATSGEKRKADEVVRF